MNSGFADIRQHSIVEPVSLTSGVVFALPHSGRDYGVSFLNQSILDQLSIRSSEDAFLDQLIDGIEKYGAPKIIANAPRAFIDLNRSTDELDPALISGIENNIRNPRISSGLGVIPRVVSHGKEIYRGKLSFEQAQSRIKYYWKPYHTDLSNLLQRSQSVFGQSLLIDIHSMPHEAVSTQSSFIKPPEIVVGDRFGMSSDPEFTNLVISILKQHEFRVAKNTPFAGAFITQHHGKVKKRIHALQLEIDRSLYMDEEKISPNSDFEELKTRLFPALIQISSLICKSEKIAAE
ncbi:MAG: N-formylglutamate amidohydrolase [Paracoccaceae bacterium]|nr:N-formylglutamate amidohydrolase [Paracoccaceae bacterium]